ncbi:MAG: AbrB/MazE/SpoVT family DNA-binding domain-containing protein [Cyclobacteriaceae bacterium]
METTLTSKGQMTLPKQVRDALHLRAGDKIVLEEQSGGGFLLRPKSNDVTILKNLVDYKGSFKSLDDMDDAIVKNAERVR